MKDKSGLDASAKLTRAKLNKRSRDADLSKDKSGLESPLELRRSWYVEGHLGDEGLSSGGNKLNSMFITAEKKTEEGMINSQPMEEEFQRVGTRDARAKTYGGATEPVLQTQKTPSPSLAFIKENIDVLRTMIKEHYQQAKMKATPRKLAYADSDKEAPTRREKLPRNIRVYEGNKDPEDHLGIFSAAAEQEEWPMPIWCKMFRQTLGGAAQNWFDDLYPKSMDSFEELSQKFLEEFSQQKRYAKDPCWKHEKCQSLPKL
ncbi:hypothetical protein Tco_0717165 [Tanacetum coccineum]